MLRTLQGASDQLKKIVIKDIYWQLETHKYKSLVMWHNCSSLLTNSWRCDKINLVWSVLDENNLQILVSLSDPVWHHANKFWWFLPAWPDDDLCKIWWRSHKRSRTSNIFFFNYLNQNGRQTKALFRLSAQIWFLCKSDWNTIILSLNGNKLHEILFVQIRFELHLYVV